MLIVVIGGTGHIGTYLIPRLVAARHQVILVSRGERGPYQSHPAWRSVRRMKVDREAAERSGSFGRQIAEKPFPRKKPPLPGITSRIAQIAVSPRRNGLSIISPGIHRWRPWPKQLQDGTSGSRIRQVPPLDREQVYRGSRRRTYLPRLPVGVARSRAHSTQRVEPGCIPGASRLSERHIYNG